MAQGRCESQIGWGALYIYAVKSGSRCGQTGTRRRKRMALSMSPTEDAEAQIPSCVSGFQMCVR